MSDSVRPHRRQPMRLPRPWDSPGKNTGVGCHCLLQCMKVKSESEVAESCLTLSHPMDCGPPGSSIHGIFQARVLEWGATAFSALYTHTHTHTHTHTYIYIYKTLPSSCHLYIYFGVWSHFLTQSSYNPCNFLSDRSVWHRAPKPSRISWVIEASFLLMILGGLLD